jgi:hypothetical protein
MKRVLIIDQELNIKYTEKKRRLKIDSFHFLD